MATGQFGHRPVLLDEALRGLALRQDAIAIDCTFGRGGHCQAMLECLGEQGQLLALDKDPEAVFSVEAMALQADPRFQVIQASFAELRQEVERRGWLGRVLAVMMDLGVSSPQLDQPERGFSFLKQGPLDMRMNNTAGESAGEWLARVSEQDLVVVLQDFGEERHARRIARAIIKQRSVAPLLTTGDLARVIETAVPWREPGKHPATRTFQAVRIFINRELVELEMGLEQALDVLAPGGRLAVIAFHSLEDRIVKRFMRDRERGFGAAVARERVEPIAHRQLLRIGKAVKPDEREVRENVRARSAVLRVAEKV